MHNPQVGDIWQYTYHTTRSRGGVQTVHMLILDEINKGKRETYLCRFLESGWTCEVHIQDSDNMKYKKVG